MKPLVIRTKQPLRICENSEFGFWAFSQQSARSFGIAARMKTFARLTALAFKDLLAGLSALSNAIQVNSRLYLACALMMVLAPLSNVAYQLLDSSARVEGWYHLNYYYFFMLLSPWLSLSIFSVGIFFLFPARVKRAYFASIPFGLAIAKIVWLSQVTSNGELNAFMPSYLYLIGFLIAFVLLFTFNWLVHRKYHKADALRARMDGILSAGFTDAEKVKMIETVWPQIKSFESNY